jgi:hypothetical protein
VTRKSLPANGDSYSELLTSVVELLDQARKYSARSINAVMTATYWELGRRVVEHEQGGRRRAGYGEELIKRLAADLSARFGRGFSWRNLFLMREFYQNWQILQASSAILPTAGISELRARTLDAGG